MIWAGIDAGSRTTKIVLLEHGGTGSFSPSGVQGQPVCRPLASGLADQGPNPEVIARSLLERVCTDSDVMRSDISRIVATGYARHAISFADTTITEITCHARGVTHLLPETRTVIEIGGQDSKILRLDESGAVRDFAMNDRCAAGSGRFLEVLADRFGIGIEALGDMARHSASPAAINSTCVVFAETEIIGLVANGAQPADIIAGVQASIAARVATLAGPGLTPPVAFTGGVALVPTMAKALEAALGVPITVAPTPQFTGALGAGLLARSCC